MDEKTESPARTRASLGKIAIWTFVAAVVIGYGPIIWVVWVHKFGDPSWREGSGYVSVLTWPWSQVVGNLLLFFALLAAVGWAIHFWAPNLILFGSRPNPSAEPDARKNNARGSP